MTRFLIVSILVGLLAPQMVWAAPVECFCVLYLRTRLHVEVRGDAWTIMPNADIKYARAGDVLLFDYGGYGEDHVALITGFYQGSDLWVNIAESNFYSCKPSTRTVRLNDPSVRGIYRPLSTATF